MSELADVARQRTAIHEGAHLSIGIAMQLPIGVTSIRGTPGYLGICGLRGTLRTRGYDAARPLVLQPARPRRNLEALVRFVLAGPASDALWFPPQGSGYVRTPRWLEEPPALPPVAQGELKRLEESGALADDPARADEDAALELAYLLVGHKLAAAYYAWAMADTRAMVADQARGIERLAEELLAHGAVAPHAARAVYRRRTP